ELRGALVERCGAERNRLRAGTPRQDHDVEPVFRVRWPDLVGHGAVWRDAGGKEPSLESDEELFLSLAERGFLVDSRRIVALTRIDERIASGRPHRSEGAALGEGEPRVDAPLQIAQPDVGPSAPCIDEFVGQLIACWRGTWILVVAILQ